MNEFPAHLIGTWQSLPDTGVSMINFPDSGTTSSGYNTAAIHWKPKKEDRSQVNSSDDSLSLLFQKTFFAAIINSTDKIVKGAWPKISAAGTYVYPSEVFCLFQQQINYDSLKRPIDTVDLYMLKNSKIYDIDADGAVSTGHNYWLEEDTLVMDRIDTVFFDLGKNVILRQLNDRFYAINIRGGLTGERSNWWVLYIIEKKSPDVFIIWECSNKMKELSSVIYAYRDRSFYFDITWTTFDLMQLMKEGYLTESDEVYLKK